MLRERGQYDEAERVRAISLPELLAAVRTPQDTDASLAERLETIFAFEAERVANAAVVAELLVPLLSEQLRPFGIATDAPPSPAPATPPAAPMPKASPAARPRPTSIADFIDAMISQDDPANSSGPPEQRRAS